MGRTSTFARGPGRARVLDEARRAARDGVGELVGIGAAVALLLLLDNPGGPVPAPVWATTVLVVIIGTSIQFTLRFRNSDAVAPIGLIRLGSAVPLAVVITVDSLAASPTIGVPRVVTALTTSVIVLAAFPRSNDPAAWRATAHWWKLLAPVPIAAGISAPVVKALTGPEPLFPVHGGLIAVLTVIVPISALVCAQVAGLLVPSVGFAIGRPGCRGVVVAIGTTLLIQRLVANPADFPGALDGFPWDLALVAAGCAVAIVSPAQTQLRPTAASTHPAVSTATVAAEPSDASTSGAAAALRTLLTTSWILAVGVGAAAVGSSSVRELPMEPLVVAGLSTLVIAVAATVSAYLLRVDVLRFPTGSMIAVLVAAGVTIVQLLVPDFVEPTDQGAPISIRASALLGWPLTVALVVAAAWALVRCAFRLFTAPTFAANNLRTATDTQSSDLVGTR